MLNEKVYLIKSILFSYVRGAKDIKESKSLLKYIKSIYQSSVRQPLRVKKLAVIHLEESLKSG